MSVSFKTVSRGGGVLFADSKALQFIFKTDPSRLPYFDFALHCTINLLCLCVCMEMHVEKSSVARPYLPFQTKVCPMDELTFLASNPPNSYLMTSSVDRKKSHLECI